MLVSPSLLSVRREAAAREGGGAAGRSGMHYTNILTERRRFDDEATVEAAQRHAAGIADALLAVAQACPAAAHLVTPEAQKQLRARLFRGLDVTIRLERTRHGMDRMVDLSVVEDDAPTGRAAAATPSANCAAPSPSAPLRQDAEDFASVVNRALRAHTVLANASTTEVDLERCPDWNVLFDWDRAAFERALPGAQQFEHRRTAERTLQEKTDTLVDEMQARYACHDTGLRCPKCASNKIQFGDAQQQRGLDEGATFTFECQRCGKTWSEAA